MRGRYTPVIDIDGQDIEVGYVYYGDPNTDGSWREYVSGTALVRERRESGTWVIKGGDDA